MKNVRNDAGADGVVFKPINTRAMFNRYYCCTSYICCRVYYIVAVGVVAVVVVVVVSYIMYTATGIVEFSDKGRGDAGVKGLTAFAAVAKSDVKCNTLKCGRGKPQ